MSQVSVTINGRQFRMACEDGQEGHLMDLARDLDTRIEGLRTNGGLRCNGRWRTPTAW